MPSVEVLERHQIAVYLGGLTTGAAVGLAWPASSRMLELAIYPVLGALLYATFLQVPFTKLAEAFRDTRFLFSALLLNFVVVPLVVAALTVVVPLTEAVLLGVLLTLLTPCIDYVIVFSGFAGGDHHRLVAASPLLMLSQMVALPLLLWLFLGPGLADIVEVGPFLEAFGILIMLSPALAWGTETLAARHQMGRTIAGALTASMVPLMAGTLFVVVASQVPKLTGRFSEVITVVPIYATFLLIMTVLGMVVARAARLDTGRSRALVFSGATRTRLTCRVLTGGRGVSTGLRVGQVAEAAGVNVETLRYYERRGIIDEPERSLGGHRLYPEATVTTLWVIKAAQNLGFTLNEVAELLEAGRHHHATPGGLQSRTEAKLTEVEEKIADLQVIRTSLTAARDAGCDDLVQCAQAECCPIPFVQIATRTESSTA